MKRIIRHHDGHGRMERLLVRAVDAPATEPPGNTSHHRYEFRAAREQDLISPMLPYEDVLRLIRATSEDDAASALTLVGFLQFQRGPFDVPGSTTGTLANAVLAVLIDHLEGFQQGPMANRQTALAITKLEEAMFWLRDRADRRAEAGILGTMKS